MRNFLLEVKKDAPARLLYTEGEQRLACGEREVYVYGVADDLYKLAERPEDRTVLGAYTVVELGAQSGGCRVLQSAMGGNKTVFYLQRGETWYVFTSLRLLQQIGVPCRFCDDRDLVCEFIYNGFIRTKETLVRGVCKLLPEEYLEIADGKLRVRTLGRVEACAQEVSLAEMYRREKAVMDRYIDLALARGEAINIAISGGYDSNLILHFLKEREVPVRAFSIGGARGLDETAVAEQLCGHKKVAAFHKGSVGPEVRKMLWEIVTVLEGDLYERGVFLQYALARLLREHQVDCILLGECADQVFNRNFYIDKKPDYLTNYTDHPYELGTMVVLKKSALMLDAFGVTGLCPFICREMQMLGAQTMEENGTSKAQQKQMCVAYFDEETNRLVGKNPGSTFLCSLFADEADEAAFICDVQQNNEFYAPKFRISYKYGPGESELDYYLCLEYLRVFKEVFCK